MRRLAAASFAFVLGALPAAARADLFSSVSYGVHASTLGYGVTLEKPLLFDFSLRLETNAISTSQAFTYDNYPYTSTARNNDVAVIADFRPYAGRWRLSGGLVFGNDRVQNTARIDGPTVRVGTGVYPSSGITGVTARVAYDRPSIYLGAGTGTGLVRGFALSFDGGVLIRNGTPSATATGPLAGTAAFVRDLQTLQAEQRTHVVVPAIGVGLVYRP